MLRLFSGSEGIEVNTGKLLSQWGVPFRTRAGTGNPSISCEGLIVVDTCDRLDFLDRRLQRSVLECRFELVVAVLLWSDKLLGEVDSYSIDFDGIRIGRVEAVVKRREVLISRIVELDRRVRAVAVDRKLERERLWASKRVHRLPD
ncbi:hypothetical protein [Saliphagus infecundisoli]|uniref:Uncharacterized protein n=1 Tax=Saliphagus infecundisoli TaxID=1849069 RepID=A0ABD5QHE7_9EURY|nr:hypothetical protein [Saliphagus infecundisoli]